MWIEAEGPHKRYVNTFAFDTLYIAYKGSGRYAICATVGSNDITIKTCDTETAANSQFTQLLQQIKNDKP